MPRSVQIVSASEGKKRKNQSKKEMPKDVLAESEDDADEEPSIEPTEQDRLNADARKAKRQKLKKAAEAAVDEEAAEDEEAAVDEEDGDDVPDPEKLKRKLRRQREHKKISGYRAKALECGYVTGAGPVAGAGLDCFASALTAADAKRLMRFCPENLSKSSYDKAECQARMALSTESVPASAARETQARCEAAMRKVMNDAMLRTIERGAMRIDAATMQSVLRPFQAGMVFTSATVPKGLLRDAQLNGILAANLADEEGMAKEKAENRELASQAKKIENDEVARKQAFRARKVELATQCAAV